MRASLHQPGKLLPESEEEFVSLVKLNKAVCWSCTGCGKPFTRATTKGPMAWAETQISGTCGNCWDEMFWEREED